MGSNLWWNLNTNKLIWRVARSKTFNMPVCLKSGLVCSPKLQKGINLMARFCNVKRFYISRVSTTTYQNIVDKEMIQQRKT